MFRLTVNAYCVMGIFMMSDNELGEMKDDPVEATGGKSAVVSISLMVVILVIGFFLVLFVLEFSRILTMTGGVDHKAPTSTVTQSADAWRAALSVAD